MAFDVRLCETAYDKLGRDEKLRRAYRAWLQRRMRQLVKQALSGVDRRPSVTPLDRMSSMG